MNYAAVWWLYGCDDSWTMLYVLGLDPVDDAAEEHFKIMGVNRAFQTAFVGGVYPRARAIVRGRWIYDLQRYAGPPMIVADGPCHLDPEEPVALASSPLPEPVFTTPAEQLLGSDETVCEPNAHRPGVLAFVKFVMDHLGGGSFGTGRPCNVGGTSGHHAARAWDWAMDAFDDDDRARVDELFQWLLKDDAELFRRAGLAYMIWDKRVWSAYRPHWRPYDGFDEQGKCTLLKCRDPHTNHVHFSFNWPGAEGDTSFYRWLDSDRPVKPQPQPPVPPVPPPDMPATASDSAAKLIPILAGSAIGFMTVRYATARWRKRHT
jgi:hypothetical protein